MENYQKIEKIGEGMTATVSDTGGYSILEGHVN